MKAEEKKADNHAELVVSVPYTVKNPLIAVWEDPRQGLKTMLVPGGNDHASYGILIADVVRHVAKYFEVDEAEVWEWVDKERKRPTAIAQQVVQ